MSELEDGKETSARQQADGPRMPVVHTEELFRGEQEIWIEHDGVRYRLRITRRNKLILQK